MTARKLALASIRSIFRNRMRSLLTSLGIIIGVASVIVMVGVGQGSQAQIAKQIAAMGTNLLVVMPPRGPREANRITKSDLAKLRDEASYLRAISGTVRLSGVKVIGGQVINGLSYWSTTVSGVESEYLKIKNWGMESGDFFTDAEDESRSKVAVLGTTVAAKLFGDQNPIGERIRIDATPFTVIGVLASKGATGMGDDQDDVVLVPLDTALTRLQQDRHLGAIEMSVAREDLMDRAQSEVETILRQAHRLAAGTASDFDVMNQAEIIKTASQTAKTLTALLAAIAGVSLLVGGIGIMNIMLVSVTERTREIGIRMSVGARKSDIMFQFLAESVMLSLLGGLIGIILAFALASVLDSLMHTPTIIEPGIVAVAALFAAAVGVFFGYYPARKAARLYPIDALRYE